MWLSGSVVVMWELRCSEAGGILVPSSSIEPSSPALQDGFLTTGPPGKSLNYYLFFILKIKQKKIKNKDKARKQRHREGGRWLLR